MHTANGEYNLGDERILATEVAYLRKRFPLASIRIVTYNPLSSLVPESPDISTISYFPNRIRKHPFRNFVAFFQNIISIFRADLIVVGGGGIFYDTEHGQSFDTLRRTWGLRFFCMQLFKKPVLFWSVGIDLSEEHLREVSWWFTYKKAKVSVRDPYSRKLLGNIGVSTVLIMDPAFLWEPAMRKSLKNSHPEISKKRIGIALRS